MLRVARDGFGAYAHVILYIYIYIYIYNIVYAVMYCISIISCMQLCFLVHVHTSNFLEMVSS